MKLNMQRLSLCSFLVAMLCVPAFGFTFRMAASDKVSPLLNTESTAQVGKVMLHQGEVYERAAIHLSEEIEFGKDGAYVLTPGFYFRVGASDGWGTYAPVDGPDAGRVKKAPGAITLQSACLYSNDGKEIALITNFYQAVNAKAKGIKRTTQLAFSDDSIQRSLVYGGRVGNKVKLGYREVWMSITKPSELQFVEYDLTESNMVESNGARIEVIEATNKNIRYRVKQAFDSTEQ